MKIMFRSVTLAVIALALWPGHVGAVSPGLIHIGEIRVESINAVGIQLAVHASLEADRDATVRSIHFMRMHLNGVPIAVGDLHRKLSLQPGQPTDLGTLAVEIPLAEIRRTDAFRPMLRDSVVSISGAAEVEVELGFWGRLLHGRSTLRVPVDIQQTVAFQAPGGALTRTGGLGAFALLDLAETAAGLPAALADVFSLLVR